MLRLGAARRRFLVIALTFALILVVLFFASGRNGIPLSFLFDPTGGNRVAQVSVASDTTWLPAQALYGFGEVLYASAAQYWGWSGLFAFTLIMISPALILVWDPAVLRFPLRRAALKGLLIYTVMAASDGALDFIPVMAFYWFIYAVFLCGWPGVRRLRSHVADAEPDLGLEPDMGPEPDPGLGPGLEFPVETLAHRVPVPAGGSLT